MKRILEHLAPIKTIVDRIRPIRSSTGKEAIHSRRSHNVRIDGGTERVVRNGVAVYRRWSNLID